MEGLDQLDVVGNISPALEATEDFIHCMDRIQGPGPSLAQKGNRQPKQLQEASSALGKLSSSGVWNLLAGEQPEVGPLGLAWADNFSVLNLGMGLRHGKRSRARSTNDLVAQMQECTSNAGNSSSKPVFKKGHNRSRSDVNNRPSAYTDNGLPSVDCNTLKNMIFNQQQDEDSGGFLLVWTTLGESCSPVPTSGGRRTRTHRHNFTGHDFQASYSAETFTWCWIAMALYCTSSSEESRTYWL